MEAPWNDVEALIIVNGKGPLEEAVSYNILWNLKPKKLEFTQSTTYVEFGRLADSVSQRIAHQCSDAVAALTQSESKFKLFVGINSKSLEKAFSRQLERLHCLEFDDERCASIWSTSSNPSDESQAHQLLDNFLKRRDEVNKIDNPYLRALIARYTPDAHAWQDVHVLFLNASESTCTKSLPETLTAGLKTLGAGLVTHARETDFKEKLADVKQSKFKYKLFLFPGPSSCEKDLESQLHPLKEMAKGEKLRASIWSKDGNRKTAHEVLAGLAFAAFRKYPILWKTFEAPKLAGEGRQRPEILIFGSGPSEEDPNDKGSPEFLESVWIYEAFFTHSLVDGQVRSYCNSHALQKPLVLELVKSSFKRFFSDSFMSSLTLVLAGTGDEDEGGFVLNGLDCYLECSDLLDLWKEVEMETGIATQKPFLLIVDQCYALKFFKNPLPENWAVQCASGDDEEPAGASFAPFFVQCQPRCSGLVEADVEAWKQHSDLDPSFRNPGGQQKKVQLSKDFSLELVGWRWADEASDIGSTEISPGSTKATESEPSSGGEEGSPLQQILRKLADLDKPTVHLFFIGFFRDYPDSAKEMFTEEMLTTPELTEYMLFLYESLRSRQTRGPSGGQKSTDTDTVDGERVREIVEFWREKKPKDLLAKDASLALQYFIEEYS